MEQIIRKTAGFFIRMVAYIPLAGASICLFRGIFTGTGELVSVIRTGAWHPRPFHKAADLDFLHYLLDDRLAEVRRPLLLFAAKIAALPATAVLFVLFALFMAMGTGLLAAAKKVESPGNE